ncbi:MAG TPA: carboxypeptidase-like regulatory domain-containing protein, partial [Candidatus Thermoplasmatota archaeon]
MRPTVAASFAMMVVLAGCTTQPHELGNQQHPPPQQSLADVVVRVQDIEVRPVAGVILVLDNQSTTTRIDGVAVFEDVPSGPHTLTASAPGFENLTRTFVSGNAIFELRLTLEPFRDPYELNYYYAEIACGGEVTCAGESAPLGGLATAPLGGFRNGTLRVEWKGGGTMSFAFEVRHGGAPLPFPDHRFALPFAGESPLRLDVPGTALSDPMRLGGVQYRLGIVDAPAGLEATHVLAGFAVRSEPGPQPRFPELNETASA